jgi:hypothetical protein
MPQDRCLSLTLLTTPLSSHALSSFKLPFWGLPSVQAHDFTHAVVDYVESMMTLQHQIVKAWEAFLPEAKTIGQ